MALNTLEIVTIQKACQAAKTLETLKGTLDELNYLYNGAPSLKTVIVQADLDALASLSGLTKQQLDDGMFVITGTLLTDLTNGLNQMLNLAVRG